MAVSLVQERRLIHLKIDEQEIYKFNVLGLEISEVIMWKCWWIKLYKLLLPLKTNKQDCESYLTYQSQPIW